MTTCLILAVTRSDICTQREWANVGNAFLKNKSVLSDKYEDAKSRSWKWSKPSLGPSGFKLHIQLRDVTLS